MYEPISSGIFTYSGQRAHTLHTNLPIPAVHCSSHKGSSPPHTCLLTADFATPASLFLVCLHCFIFFLLLPTVDLSWSSSPLLTSHYVSSPSSYYLTPAFPPAFAHLLTAAVACQQSPITVSQKTHKMSA